MNLGLGLAPELAAVDCTALTFTENPFSANVFRSEASPSLMMSWSWGASEFVVLSAYNAHHHDEVLLGGFCQVGSTAMLRNLSM